MSVINQMLRDLEQRKVKQTASRNKSGRYNDVLNIVEKKRFNYWWYLVLIFIMVIFSASWYFFNRPVAQQSSMIQELNSSSIVQGEPIMLGLAKAEASSQQNKAEVIERKRNTNLVETVTSQKLIQQEQPEKRSTAEAEKHDHENLVNLTQQEVELVEKHSFKQPSMHTEIIIKSDKQTAISDKIIDEDSRKNNNAVNKITVKTYAKKSVETPTKKSVETLSKKSAEALATPPKEALFKKQPSKSISTELVHQARLLMDVDQNAALQLLENNLTKVTADADYYALLANLYQRKQRFDEAIGFYRKALAIEPYKGELWMGIALAYRSQGEMDNSVIAFKKALTTENMSPNLRQYAKQQISKAGAESEIIQ